MHADAWGDTGDASLGAGDRAREYNAAILAGLHVGKHCLDRNKGAAQVDGHDPVPVRQGHHLHTGLAVSAAIALSIACIFAILCLVTESSAPQGRCQRSWTKCQCGCQNLEASNLLAESQMYQPSRQHDSHFLRW
jgi:hypothetical protein